MAVQWDATYDEYDQLHMLVCIVITFNFSVSHLLHSVAFDLDVNLSLSSD